MAVSKKIKGISIEIGGSTTGLEKALNEVNGKSSKLVKELREVEKALKFNPKNVELLQQKQELLNAAVSNSKNKVEALKAAQQKVSDMFKNGDIGADEYREFQRELITTESSLHSFENQLEQTNDTIRDNREETEQGTKKQRNFKEMLSGVGSKISELKEKFQNIVAKLKAFGDAAKKVADVSLKALAAGIKSVANTVEIGIKGFAKYAQAIAAVTTAGAAFAVKSGATFEASMSKVQSLSGATGDELKQLEEKAKEMGASTSKSAAESADALGYMALAGWETEEMLAGLEPILRASEAGAMDLATCSDLVTDSMSALGKGTDELSHYLDVVSKTQASANTSMQGMLEAYVGCGSTLKNLEVPLETSATLIGVLANRGIKGSEAGTALNSVLVNLMGVSGQASEALDMLGVSLYQNGQRRDITDMLTELNSKLASCDDQTRDTFTAMIGGKTQMDTLQALLAGLSEEYSELNGKIKDCDGYMLEAAKTMQDNVQGAFTALKSAAEGAGIAVYDTFKGKLKDTIQEITSYISNVTELVNKNGLTGLLFAFDHIKKQAIDYIINSIPDIVQTISESAAVFNSGIVNMIDVITGTLPQISEKALPVLQRSFFGMIDKLIERIPTIIPQIISMGTQLITGIVDGMLNSAEKLTETFPRIFRLAIPVISKTIPEIFSKGTEIITTLAGGIIKSIPTIINAVQKCAVSIVSNLITSFLPLLPDLVSAGLELISALLDGILSALPQIITTVTSCIGSLLQAIMEHLPEILDAGVKILMAIISGIIDMLPQLISTAVDLLLLIVDTLLNNLDLIIEAALQIVIALCVAILDNIDKIWEYIPKLIEGILTAIIDNLDILIQAAIEILVTIGAALVSCAGELIAFIPQVTDAIVNAFCDHDWKQTGKDILESIFDGILEIGEKASDVLKPAVNKISEFINEGIRGINDIIDGINGINIGGQSLNLNHISEIPMLAKGGILSSGSAIVGEAGAELLTVANGKAVVQPLTSNNYTNNSAVQNTIQQPLFSGDIVIPVHMYPNSAEFSRVVITAGQLNAAMTGGR